MNERSIRYPTYDAHLEIRTKSSKETAQRRRVREWRNGKNEVAGPREAESVGANPNRDGIGHYSNDGGHSPASDLVYGEIIPDVRAKLASGSRACSLLGRSATT